MSVRIYHNPRCSKSRASVKLLRERGIDVEIIDYLKHPPNHQELARLLELLGLEPRQLLRTQEPAYREAGLERAELSREEIIEAMVQYPILIERPILVHGNKAVLGRPPENILSIL